MCHTSLLRTRRKRCQVKFKKPTIVLHFGCSQELGILFFSWFFFFNYRSCENTREKFKNKLCVIHTLRDITIINRNIQFNSNALEAYEHTLTHTLAQAHIVKQIKLNTLDSFSARKRRFLRNETISRQNNWRWFTETEERYSPVVMRWTTRCEYITALLTNYCLECDRLISMEFNVSSLSSYANCEFGCALNELHEVAAQWALFPSEPQSTHCVAVKTLDIRRFIALTHFFCCCCFTHFNFGWLFTKQLSIVAHSRLVHNDPTRLSMIHHRSNYFPNLSIWHHFQMGNST